MAVTDERAQASAFLGFDTQSPHYKWMVAGTILLAEGTGTFAGNSVNLDIPRLMGAPTGILSTLPGLLVLQQQRDYRGEPVDYPGLLALAAFLIPLLLVISWGRDDNTTALSTLILLSACALLGGFFLLASIPMVFIVSWRFGPAVRE
jgi:hypothetical protein